MDHFSSISIFLLLPGGQQAEGNRKCLFENCCQPYLLVSISLDPRVQIMNEKVIISIMSLIERETETVIFSPLRK